MKYLSMAVGIILIPLILMVWLIWMVTGEIADWWSKTTRILRGKYQYKFGNHRAESDKWM